MDDIFKNNDEQLNLFGETKEEEIQKSLFDKFIIPPFSVFDGRQGYWQKRKNLWKNLGIKREHRKTIERQHFLYNCCW